MIFRLLPMHKNRKSLSRVSGIVTQPELTGDFDLDGDIDGLDLSVFSATYGLNQGHPEYNSKADLYPDGHIDERDLGIFLQYFGQTLDCEVGVLE